MTARVLVVDDIDFNVKLLDTKLKQEYYTVFVAYNGKEALVKAKETQPDIILMDIMMPEMDGFDATKILKADPDLGHIPIIMVTALNAQEDKVKGLECGADDFLTKPINDTALFARLRSLVRMKVMLDELRLRDKTSKELGVAQDKVDKRNSLEGANVLLIEDDVIQVEKIKKRLFNNKINVDVAETLEKIISSLDQKDYSLIIVSTLLLSTDGLRLCSELRSHDKARNVPILIIVDENDERTLHKGLEMGVNDYLVSPVDLNELMARCTTQIRRKNYQDQLKDNYLATVTQSVTDGLTGLHNRRYFDTHFANMVSQAQSLGRNLSVIMVDIDHFKKVNDDYGHQAGDAVLKEVSRRLELGIRTSDMSSRFGGEEFVIVLPETNGESAGYVAERLRMIIEDVEFAIPVEPKQITCTASFGVASLRPGDTAEGLIKRADTCLYKAKESGRNKFVSDTE
jgi:two-component system, cell cycle response regulator